MQNADSWQEHLRAYQEADAFYRSGNLRAAKAEFRRALSLAPDDVDTLWALGDCYSESAMPRKAEAYFRKALARADWSQRGDLLYNIANALLDQGRPSKALVLYRKISKKATAYSLARKNIRVALRRISKLER